MTTDEKGNPLTYWGGLEEPKQETTLKEVAERLKGKELFKESNDRARKILSEIKSLPIQEISYSEEDMAESFMACWKANVPEGFECKLSFKEWFEQFKNK